MDSELNQAMYGETPNSPKVGLFEISFVIISLVLVFGALNYFNILRLSEIFPNYLSFLPRKDVPTGTSQQSQQLNNVVIKQLKISCPSVKAFCQEGQNIVKDGKYIGWGGKLSTGSAIFAAFNGDLTVSISTVSAVINTKTVQNTFKIIYLDNKDIGLRGIYYFRGSIPKSGKVAKGEQITTANGKTISIYDDDTLIFSLIKGYPAVNTPTILNKEDFE